MATVKDDGGNAFTALYHDDTPGMTLRDWFSGKVAANHMQLNSHNINDYQAKETARWAYMVADAMLAERNK